MTDLDVWSLVQQGLFEEACRIADIEFQNTKKVYHLRNKIYALFHLKNYCGAIETLENIIKIEEGESESDFKFLGIANWILGDVSKAIDAWQQAQNSLYKDAAGGIGIQVFLYFSGVKTGQDKLKSTAIKAIKKLLKSKRAINFPGPLGHYLIDDINDEELLSCIATVPILRERQLCQAHFVLAIKRLEVGDTEGYYKKLKDCISYGASSYLEQMYYLAKGELETSAFA
jgi:tetratricopeptide (TPR) repeat protein